MLNTDSSRPSPYMICYKKLAHVIIEAEKSHSLQPASWRPGQLVVEFQLESEGL